MTVYDHVFRDAHVVLPTATVRGWVAVRGEIIAAIGAGGDAPSADRVIDAAGRYLLPGRIDTHLHLGVYQPYEEDLAITSRMAVAGGTTLLMPMNRVKQSYFDVFPDWVSALERRSPCDMLVHLQIQARSHIDELPRYHRELGVGCYKLHLDYRANVGDLDIQPLDDGDVYLTMRQVAAFDGLVAVHCEDVEIERYTIEEVVSSGAADLRAWSRARPPFCEIADLHTVAYLSQVTGARAVVVHLSTAEGVREAQRWSDPPLTIETLVHFLTMDADEAQQRVGSALGKMNPPLRDAENSAQLWAALRDGHVSVIGTDHVLCDKDPAQGLWEAHTSAPEIEFALPLLLTHGVLADRIPLERLVEAMSLAPARLYGIEDRKGSITVGKDADLVLVDLDARRTVGRDHTETHYPTSADGLSLRGWPDLTMVRGTVVYEHGEVLVDSGGRMLRSTL